MFKSRQDFMLYVKKGLPATVDEGLPVTLAILRYRCQPFSSQMKLIEEECVCKLAQACLPDLAFLSMGTRFDGTMAGLTLFTNRSERALS